MDDSNWSALFAVSDCAGVDTNPASELLIKCPWRASDSILPHCSKAPNKKNTMSVLVWLEYWWYDDNGILFDVLFDALLDKFLDTDLVVGVSICIGVWTDAWETTGVLVTGEAADGVFVDDACFLKGVRCCRGDDMDWTR